MWTSYPELNLSAMPLCSTRNFVYNLWIDFFKDIIEDIIHYIAQPFILDPPLVYLGGWCLILRIVILINYLHFAL